MRRLLTPLVALLLASLSGPALAQSFEPSPSVAVATAPYDVEVFQGLQGMEQDIYRLHIWPGASSISRDVRSSSSSRASSTPRRRST